jgi:hypothetical protein
MRSSRGVRQRDAYKINVIALDEHIYHPALDEFLLFSIDIRISGNIHSNFAWRVILHELGSPCRLAGEQYKPLDSFNFPFVVQPMHDVLKERSKEREKD